MCNRYDLRGQYPRLRHHQCPDSQYLACYRDAYETFPMGDNVYKLTLSPNIRVQGFWSVTTNLI